MFPISVNDSGQATSGATANLGGGVTFGSMGSGKHTTGAAVPPWVWAVAAVAAALLILPRRRKG
jgi:MYXO-CTERM domain-containing protein